MIKAVASVDPKVMEALREAHLRALSRATVYLWSQIQETLNVPNSGVRVKRKRGRGSYTSYPSPSAPGQAPRKRTGWLQRNVVYSIDKSALSSRVGLTANAAYGIALETGTRRMAARPWLKSTAETLAPQMAEIMRRELGA